MALFDPCTCKACTTLAAALLPLDGGSENEELQAFNGNYFNGLSEESGDRNK